MAASTAAIPERCSAAMRVYLTRAPALWKFPRFRPENVAIGVTAVALRHSGIVNGFRSLPQVHRNEMNL